jgi:hypothetical protein
VNKKQLFSIFTTTFLALEGEVGQFITFNIKALFTLAKFAAEMAALAVLAKAGLSNRIGSIYLSLPWNPGAYLSETPYKHYTLG